MDGGIGQLFLTILSIAIYAIPISLSVWALLDVASRPAWAWALSDRSRQLWMFSILCGILLVPAGLAISIYYLVRVRPQIAAVEHGDIRE